MEDRKPRRLRIIERGLTTFTGILQGVDFVDGVSEHPVGWREAAIIGGAMQVEDADKEGYQVNPVLTINRLRDTSVNDPHVLHAERNMYNAHVKMEFYTRKQLEAIADRSGLQGLREIAAVWQTGARSINDIILRILEAQDKYRAEHPEPEDLVQETETEIKTDPELPNDAVGIIKDIQRAADQIKTGDYDEFLSEEE